MGLNVARVGDGGEHRKADDHEALPAVVGKVPVQHVQKRARHHKRQITRDEPVLSRSNGRHGLAQAFGRDKVGLSDGEYRENPERVEPGLQCDAQQRLAILST